MTAGNPARIYGLAPKKGDLAVGRDADVTLLDPKATWTVTVDDALHRQKWTPYEGKAITGRVVRTIRRGETIFDDARHGDSASQLHRDRDGSWHAGERGNDDRRRDAVDRCGSHRRRHRSALPLRWLGGDGRGASRLHAGVGGGAGSGCHLDGRGGLRVERDVVGNVWGYLDGADARPSSPRAHTSTVRTRVAASTAHSVSWRPSLHSPRCGGGSGRRERRWRPCRSSRRRPRDSRPQTSGDHAPSSARSAWMRRGGCGATMG